ncbi:MAG: acyl-coenzyme synthetase/AMP-(fatty) acid ligase, partial [Microbacterium sp.]|nr:acyl-coenzyme synthetase/AMP-(fatty) acid ligase [Microbacterium sp.]
DPDRYRETYWEKFADKGYYFAGDGARLDDDGDVWLLGRVDDVMNVSGHRLSTAEIESALVGHEGVAESAVVGASDETTGQAVVAFVIIKSSYLKQHPVEGLGDELRKWVGEQIGPIARPRDVYIVGELPKTRSGKIMRRLGRHRRHECDQRAGEVSTSTREVPDATPAASGTFCVYGYIAAIEDDREPPEAQLRIHSVSPTELRGPAMRASDRAYATLLEDSARSSSRLGSASVARRCGRRSRAWPPTDSSHSPRRA